MKTIFPLLAATFLLIVYGEVLRQCDRVVGEICEIRNCQLKFEGIEA